MRRLSLRTMALALAAGCVSPVAPQLLDTCAPPEGWRDVARGADGQVVTFGELHGTDQGPDVLAEYICAVVSTYRGKTVVGVEIFEGYQQPMREALGADRPRDALVENMEAHWRGQDGRASEAVLRFLSRMAALQKAGADLEVVAFVNFGPEAMAAIKAGERFDQTIVERDYAERMLEASQTADRTIVMVGNLHAAKAAGQYSFVDFEPMASFFPEGSLSFDIVHDGGEAWGSTGRRRGAVSSQRASPKRPEPGPHPRMQFDETMQPFFDGYFYVGPLTPSPPVLPPPDVAE